ncbi:hypothetical protein M436DRAFT_75635 [Aureobasidium namibiae CBS 147.97]|uniref:Uncharacterized protein n=1 Tax=Aureobasidium namibiae CBS 147.97 TaxID=1043004 RepID=A0A074WAB6_9PEZI|nr:uncharacterized protein M436DRAFT_75635 [Aureobasidium namibiae CBS 147.97]KEQ69868.1 hypothetical protein M436DRAFT_75635 [Aureobasidium namibiae CBS 147.97]
MAEQARFEPIPTKIIESEHTSLSSTDYTGHEYGVEPGALSLWQAGKIFGIVMDVLAIVLSCMFFSYALAVKTHEKKPMGSPQVKLLVRLSNLGPTIYPILFAAVVGRALKSIAFWKLEKGGRIGTLDRLLGSITIFQTVLTQIQMRTWSFLGLLLVAVWSLSPLGSQASLRIIDTATQPSNTSRPLQYVNTTSDFFNFTYAGVPAASQFVPVNVLFGAAMLGSSASSSFYVDNWGNLKIPWVEGLDTMTADGDGWYPVKELKSTDDFASLIGIPLSTITLANNLTTSFSIETSYWTFACPVFEDLGDGVNASTGHFDNRSYADLTASQGLFIDSSESAVENTTSYTAQNLYLYSVNTHDNSEPWDSPVNTRPRHITYMDNNNDPGHWIAANCTIKTTYVEVNASCSSDNCAFYQFAIPLIEALPAGTLGEASPYQKFIIDPSNPFNQSFYIPAVTVLSNATFALRLGQLFNTFWMAMIAPTAIPKGLRNSNLTADIARLRNSSLLTATATETRDNLVLRCNLVWFVILLVSSAITAVIGLCGLIATICRLGPDIGFNISSLVKDSSFEDQVFVPTTLGSTDRSILMKDWYAKLGDTASEEEAGYIAIGSGNVADLQRGRLYR